nr:MAG: hypothetical protein [Microvirus sp.]
MVKKHSTVCLDPNEPIAKVYHDRDMFEQITIPDISPSLYQMVNNSSALGLTGNNSKYQYPELDDDDNEAHDSPDYEKIDKLDIVEKTQFVEEWKLNPKLYEKVETIEETTIKKDEPEKGSV